MGSIPARRDQPISRTELHLFRKRLHQRARSSTPDLRAVRGASATPWPAIAAFSSREELAKRAPFLRCCTIVGIIFSAAISSQRNHCACGSSSCRSRTPTRSRGRSSCAAILRRADRNQSIVHQRLRLDPRSSLPLPIRIAMSQPPERGSTISLPSSDPDLDLGIPLLEICQARHQPLVGERGGWC